VIEKQGVRLREFEARYEAMGRAMKALDEFQAQVVHGQKQTAELQRLSEERQRKELSEWQGENEQRWKKETLRWDYTIGEQQKVNAKLIERFPPLERQLALLQREVEALWRSYESQGGVQLQNAQRLLDAIGASLTARPKQES
jgi:predicted RNase H-like nuclease (RuvC/YqgF family)